jgi:hypothetical protein
MSSQVPWDNDKIVRYLCRIVLCFIDFLILLLKLDKNIDLYKVKFDLKCQIDNGFCKNNYPFEINLIYKIIHEHTNYESYQWQLFGNDKKIVDKEIQSLLIAISALDRSLTWDCLSVLSRYRNLYKLRKKITNTYIRSVK